MQSGDHAAFTTGFEGERRVERVNVIVVGVEAALGFTLQRKARPAIAAGGQLGVRRTSTRAHRRSGAARWPPRPPSVTRKPAGSGSGPPCIAIGDQDAAVTSSADIARTARSATAVLSTPYSIAIATRAGHRRAHTSRLGCRRARASLDQPPALGRARPTPSDSWPARRLPAFLPRIERMVRRDASHRRAQRRDQQPVIPPAQGARDGAHRIAAAAVGDQPLPAFGDASRSAQSGRLKLVGQRSGSCRSVGRCVANPETERIVATNREKSIGAVGDPT